MAKKDTLKVASGIFELRKGDWRQIKDDSGGYNQEYLRRIRNGIPVKTAKNKPSLKIKKKKTA
jgi:hypothetical protein